MAVGNYTAKKVAKGRITNLRTGNSVEFSINPHTVRVMGGADISKDGIPGFSSPLLRFASGKVKQISFTLSIDGEMTKRKFGAQVLNAIHEDRDAISYDISNEIDWYDSLTYPTNPELPGSDGGLDRVVFSYGSYFNGIQCFVEKADPTITEFDPDLNPTKANIEIVLLRIDDANIFSTNVWDF